MANKKKNSDKAIYRLYMDFRGGEITGMFLADKKYIEYMIEHEVSVHFGEVLGKHSDVRTTICDSDIEMVSDEENVIDFFKKYKFENGYNPLTEFFDPYGTEGFNEPEDGIEWSDCCVEEWIEYKMFGTIPEYYRTNKEIVKGKATLAYIKAGGFAVYDIAAVDGNLYQLTIDMKDTNDVGAEACFLPVYEKAITLMRWIRRSNENGTLLKISE